MDGTQEEFVLGPSGGGAGEVRPPLSAEADGRGRDGGGGGLPDEAGGAADIGSDPPGTVVVRHSTDGRFGGGLGFDVPVPSLGTKRSVPGSTKRRTLS